MARLMTEMKPKPMLFSLEMNGDYGRLYPQKNATIQQPGFDITDKMREQAAQGRCVVPTRRGTAASFAASPCR